MAKTSPSKLASTIEALKELRDLLYELGPGTDETNSYPWPNQIDGKRATELAVMYPGECRRLMRPDAEARHKGVFDNPYRQIGSAHFNQAFFEAPTVCRVRLSERIHELQQELEKTKLYVEGGFINWTCLNGTNRSLPIHEFESPGAEACRDTVVLNIKSAGELVGDWRMVRFQTTQQASDAAKAVNEAIAGSGYNAPMWTDVDKYFTDALAEMMIAGDHVELGCLENFVDEEDEDECVPVLLLQELANAVLAGKLNTSDPDVMALLVHITDLWGAEEDDDLTSTNDPGGDE